ncbi:MAG: penicillin-binding protein 2 [Candidatus Promineifilaceae bacterium]
MNNSQQRRLWIVVTGLIFAISIIIIRLFIFQIVQGPKWASRLVDEEIVVARPERGIILDRNEAVLAANTAEYRIGVSPRLVENPKELATVLTSILQQPRYEILQKLESPNSYETLAASVPIETANLIWALEEESLQVDVLPRRFYPQGELMCHTLGYVDFDGQGGAGLEAYYQSELAGEAASARVKISPLEFQESVIAREGADLVLTIDRSVQYLVEQHLARALQEHGAESGEIIVLDPRTGAILAMAALPCYNPERYYEYAPTEEELEAAEASGIEIKNVLQNPLVTNQYEPGSVMKLITMAAALDSGTVTPQTTYYDGGVLEVGGHRTVNWDRSAPGTVDMTTLLARSLNVGAATLATWMGPDTFYDYMRRFGFGRTTGIDVMAEWPGDMPLPGSPNWTESFLATNSYGQSLAVTPLQMVTAVSAIANHGELMQPYVVQEMRGHGQTIIHEPVSLGQVISPQVADQVTAMAITAVASEVGAAQVPGYTVAGKTGTAQIPDWRNGGYHPTDVIGSFIGWLPADDPEIIILVKLDRPQSAPWGSQTAAPVFSELAQDLVVMLNIPPDNYRLQAEITAARLANGSP